jgi:hypothetical protein
VVAHTIPLRTTKGKSVAYLAWKLTNLAGQEVGEVDPAAGFPDPMTTEETKAPEGGAGEARLPNSAATVRPNPPRLWRKAARQREAVGVVDPMLGRPDPATAAGDVRAGPAPSCNHIGEGSLGAEWRGCWPAAEKGTSPHRMSTAVQGEGAAAQGEMGAGAGGGGHHLDESLRVYIAY